MNYSKLERNIATEKQFLKSQTCPPLSLSWVKAACFSLSVLPSMKQGFAPTLKKVWPQKAHVIALFLKALHT